MKKNSRQRKPGWYEIDSILSWWDGKKWEKLDEGWYSVGDETHYWNGQDWLVGEEPGFYEVAESEVYWNGSSWEYLEEDDEEQITKPNKYVSENSYSGFRGLIKTNLVNEIKDESTFDINWTSTQLKVIQYEAKSRLLVDAGPGTGKTSTACARVAWLIEENGIQPHEILLTSFTNAAVHEIRNRIKRYLENPDLANGLRISTLDSFAWNLRSGFNYGEMGFSSHDENIDKAIEVVRKDENAKEFLQTVSHLVVDEAQDFTGVRAQLILSIFENLKEECGITVFCDEAQAIYGFSEMNGNESEGETLPDLMRDPTRKSSQFIFASLEEIHRTSEGSLLEIFQKGRKTLVKSISSNEASNVYRNIREILLKANPEKVGSSYELFSEKFRPEFFHSNQFVLFRKRTDALLASQYLSGYPHKLRLPGYPVVLKPWIARCFWDADEDKISEAAFRDLCSKRTDLNVQEIKSNWQSLLREAGLDRNRISLRKLANILSRPNAPGDFCLKDYGLEGPSLGTVHAAKGRESDDVVLFLPANPNFESERFSQTDKEIIEEAKILYVGATRAKNSLTISDTKTIMQFKRSGALASNNRAYMFKNESHLRISAELGINGDIDAEGLVGKRYFSDMSGAVLAQKELWNNRNKSIPLKAEAQSNLGFSYRVSVDYSEFKNANMNSDKPTSYKSELFYFSNALNRDLFIVGKMLNRGRLRPPLDFRYFYSMGTRTVAMASDDPMREDLNDPWRSSGFMLAPIIMGFPDFYLKRYGR